MVKTVFFGTPAFALPTLERLIRSPHRVVAVVTQPDRPRGRGRRVSPSPVKRLAGEHGIPVLEPERLRDEAFRQRIAAHEPDLAVVAAYGRLLPDPLLATPRLGTINVHASLLPKYRGAAPIQRAILAGETTTGITIIRLVREMDAGPMLAWRARAIGPDETSVAVERGLADLGADLLLEAVAALDSGTAAETPQEHAAATFAPRITRDDGRIDWGRPSRALHDQVRGLHPWPHAFTYLDGARYLILASRVAETGVRRRRGRCRAGNAARGVRRSARGRRRRRFGPRDHGDPARGPPAVAGARVPRGTPLGAGPALRPRAAVTAPSRRAAHRVLRSVHRGRADLATALDRARGRLDDPRDRALAGRHRDRDAALARRNRPPAGTGLAAPARAHRRRRARHPAGRRLPAPLPGSRAGARRRARRGSPEP